MIVTIIIIKGPHGGVILDAHTLWHRSYHTD